MSIFTSSSGVILRHGTSGEPVSDACIATGECDGPGGMPNSVTVHFSAVTGLCDGCLSTTNCDLPARHGEATAVSINGSYTVGDERTEYSEDGYQCKHYHEQNTTGTFDYDTGTSGCTLELTNRPMDVDVDLVKKGEFCYVRMIRGSGSNCVSPFWYAVERPAHTYFKLGQFVPNGATHVEWPEVTSSGCGFHEITTDCGDCTAGSSGGETRYRVLLVTTNGKCAVTA